MQTMVTGSLRVALPAAAAARADGAATGALDISVFPDFETVERVWRAFEPAAVRSIYQRFDWLAAWWAHAGRAAGVEPLIVLGCRNGAPLFLLPFGRRRTRLGRFVTWLGGSHVNVNLGLYDRDFASSLSSRTMRALFRTIAPHLGGDLLVLGNQPETWEAVVNPFALLPGKLADQSVFAMRLEPDFEAVLRRHNGARKRKKLRWQENNLARLGGYRFARAGDAAEAGQMLDAFFAQKAVQFARSGVDDVFAEPGVRAFFRDLALRSERTDKPLIQLHGIEIAGAIRATFASGIDRGRVHGYFSGMSLDAFARVGPGDLLLHHLIRECCERGFTTFDLGVGDERYKSSWETVAEPQFRTVLPLSAWGRVLAPAYRAAGAARIAIRQNRTLWPLAKRLRERLAGRKADPTPSGEAGGD